MISQRWPKGRKPRLPSFVGGEKASKPVSKPPRPESPLALNKRLGHIDFFRDGQVVGWALDVEQNKPILRITIDNVQVGVVVCEEQRDDLDDAGHTSARGFRFDVPARYFDGQRHELVAAFLDGEALGFSTDFGLKTSLQFRSDFTPEFDGHLDGIEGDVVSGWVVSWNSAASIKNGSNHVAIYCDGLLVGQMVADQSRPDVGDALAAEPTCGFSFQIPANRLRVGMKVEVVTFPHRWMLRGSPLTVERLPTAERGRLRQLEAELERISVDLWRMQRELRTISVPQFRMLSAYAEWATHYFPNLASRAPRMADRVSAKVSVLCPVFRPRLKDFVAAVDSVIAQTYPYWELIVVDDASGQADLSTLIDQLAARDDRIKVLRHAENKGISDATNTAIGAATGDLIAFFDHDDLLVPCALDYMVEAIIEQDAIIAYSDEDKIDDYDRLSDPNFKPDWNLRFLLSQNYVCHLLVARREAVLAAGPFSAKYNGAQDHDFILRMSDVVTSKHIIHVSEVLYHWRRTPNSTAETISNKAYAIEAGVAAVAEYLKRHNIRAHVSSRGAMTNYVIDWVLTEKPSVSIIIPFKDKADLTKRCLEMLRRNTDYPNFEIVLVNNFSLSSDAEDLLLEVSAMPEVRVLDISEPFNYSRLNNLAVAGSTSELVLFLNNDVLISDRCWLTQLVGELAWREDVGAVGCRLLFENGTVQHAGVVLGGGEGSVAEHPFRGLAPHDPGFMGRAVCSQEYSAVTAACLLTRRALFNVVGGFDEQNLTVAFNDVDLCLKIRELGHRVIWRAETTLEHRESASRSSDMAGHKLGRFVSEHVVMRERWGDVLANDPHYNRNFSLEWGVFAALKSDPWV